MKQTKQKFYTVWHGWQTGVFDNWADCQAATFGYSNSSFQSFSTGEEAQEAFNNSYIRDTPNLSYDYSVSEGIVVDGAFSSSTQKGEYRGVNLKTGNVIFESKIFRDGSNNIFEFLSVVHALAYCNIHNFSVLPIYTDSNTALRWVKNKQVNTSITKKNSNQRTFYAVEQALSWLNTTEYSNPVLKWQTKEWGENPADFGRK